jgi:hypothetical protein
MITQEHLDANAAVDALFAQHHDARHCQEAVIRHLRIVAEINGLPTTDDLVDGVFPAEGTYLDLALASSAVLGGQVAPNYSDIECRQLGITVAESLAIGAINTDGYWWIEIE